MKKQIVKDLKNSDHVNYVFYNPTIEKCYKLYEKGFIFIKLQKEVSGIYQERLQNFIQVRKEESI